MYIPFCKVIVAASLFPLNTCISQLVLFQAVHEKMNGVNCAQLTFSTRSSDVPLIVEVYNAPFSNSVKTSMRSILPINTKCL